MNLLKHPIYKSIYDLCVEIDKLPPSDHATKLVVMAGNLQKPADELLDKIQSLELQIRNSEHDKTAKNSRLVEFQFSLGQKVIVREIQRPGVVTGLRQMNSGNECLVAWWNDGHRSESWLYEHEIECRTKD